MEFYEVVNNRKTVRDFKEQTIPQEVLIKILGAGLKAPTHNHQREWEFVVLHEKSEKDDALQFVKEFAMIQGENKMASIASATPMQKMYADAMPKQYTMLNNSSSVILPFFKANASLFHPTSVSSLNSFASVWCCIENIFLAATAEGLVCSMRIPVGEEGKKVAKVVGAPDGYMLPCYIGIGYPAEDATVLEQVECNLQERIHLGKW
jgi:nitroreductase